MVDKIRRVVMTEAEPTVSRFTEIEDIGSFSASGMRFLRVGL